MSSILLTMGYGRTTKAEFLDRLLRLVGVYGNIAILDVRKKRGSRNGKWCYAGSPLRETLSLIHIDYRWLEYLGNTFGGTASGLNRYSIWLNEAGQRAILRSFREELKHIYGFNKVACLLCAERKPFIRGTRPNCHRIILARNAEYWSPIFKTVHVA